MIMVAGAFCITQMPSPGAAQSAADLAKSMQDQWKRCLRNSYETYERRTPNKNSAAELAFQFCATQEETLWIYSSESGVSQSAFAQSKVAAKRALIAGK